MTQCPKCGHRRIVGPLYEQDERGERLRWRCGTCGFSSVTPTRDAANDDLLRDFNRRWALRGQGRDLMGRRVV